MTANIPGPATPPGGHMATTVSADDVKRVVSRALAQGTRRLRLTYGQRLAIVNAPGSEARAGS